jgi:hypothetical protein
VVDLRVEGVAICARARVLYANPPGPERAPTRPAGVGVVFETLPPAHDASLRAHVAAQVERLRV